MVRRLLTTELRMGSTGIKSVDQYLNQLIQAKASPDNTEIKLECLKKQSLRVTQFNNSWSEDSVQNKRSEQIKKKVKQFENIPISHSIKRADASKTWEIPSTHKIPKLGNNGEPVFLHIIRSANEVPRVEDE